MKLTGAELMAHVESVERERTEARRTIKRLRKALRFYANADLYEMHGASIDPDDGSRGDALLRRWDLIDDGGATARDALNG